MDAASNPALPWRKRVGQAVWQLKCDGYFKQPREIWCPVGSFMVYFILIGIKPDWTILVVPLLFLPWIAYPPLRALVLRYLARERLLAGWTAGHSTWQDLLQFHGLDLAQAKEERSGEIAETIKLAVDHALATILRCPPIALIDRANRALFWTACSVAALLMLLSTTLGAPLTERLRGVPWISTFIKPALAGCLILAMTCLFQMRELFRSVLFQALIAELGPDYPLESRLRLPGSLKQRVDRAYFSQHTGFYGIFWIAGLLPVLVCLLVWAYAMLDNPWQAAPILAAVTGSLILATTELFRWRVELKQALADTSVAVEITDAVLNQASLRSFQPSFWRQVSESLASQPDPVYSTAARLGFQLPRRMTLKLQQQARWRLWLEVLAFMAINGLWAWCCWSLVLDGGERIGAYFYGFVVGGVHLAILLSLVRAYLPQVEVLAYLNQHL